MTYQRIALFAALTLAAAVFLECVPPAAAKPSPVAEPYATRVIDGDTLRIGRTVLRLRGMDAPESGQTRDHRGHILRCGLDAAFELRQAIEKGVTPKIVGAAITGRDEAFVTTRREGSRDLAEAMPKAAGYAVTTETADGVHVDAERSAKRASLGIRGTAFALPNDWRRGHQAPDRARGGRDFLIKGAVKDAGRRLCRRPLDVAYKNLLIDPSKGERMFRSGDEARRIGWKRPGEGM